jgi:hypothetical protein
MLNLYYQIGVRACSVQGGGGHRTTLDDFKKKLEQKQTLTTLPVILLWKFFKSYE